MSYVMLYGIVVCYTVKCTHHEELMFRTGIDVVGCDAPGGFSFRSTLQIGSPVDVSLDLKSFSFLLDDDEDGREMFSAFEASSNDVCSRLVRSIRQNSPAI